MNENIERETKRAPWPGRALLKRVEKEAKLNGLSCRRAGRSYGSAGERVAAGFFLLALVDFDGALKVGAVFDHDAGRGQVAVDRSVLLDFNSVFRAKVSLHRTVHHHLAGNDVGCYFCCGSDRQFPL